MTTKWLTIIDLFLESGQSINSGSTEEVPAFLVVALYFSVTMFVHCVFGNLVTGDADRVADAVYNTTDWLNYPPVLRRSLIPIIHHMQRPLHLYGFGLNAWECSLENFTNVMALSIILRWRINAFFREIFSSWSFPSHFLPFCGHSFEFSRIWLYSRM